MTDQDFSDYMESSALHDVVTCHQLAAARAEHTRQRLMRGETVSNADFNQWQRAAGIK